MASSFQGAHVPQEMRLMGVRGYVADPLSSRHVEDLLEERGGPVAHATLPRWGVHYRPLWEAALHRRTRSGWRRWRMDETSSKVTGQWYYLYGAVAKPGQTLACLLTEHRDEAAARRLRQKALRRPGVPEKSPLDGRAAHAAAIQSDNAEHGTASIIR
jgi:putative transposase